MERLLEEIVRNIIRLVVKDACVEFEEDWDGQVVIYTGMKLDNGNLVLYEGDMK